MKKIIGVLFLSLFLFGCGTGSNGESPGMNGGEEPDQPSGNATDIAFNPEEPVLNVGEVDWIDIEVPDDAIYTTDSSIMYRLSIEPSSSVQKLVDPIIQRREGEEWVDVTPKEGNPNFDYHEMETVPDVKISISLVGFNHDPSEEPVEHEVGRYRAIEVFIREEGEEREVVQVEIPFEVVEEVIPDEIENPESVSIDPEELIFTPETDAVTNNYEEYNLNGGEYYRLEYYDGENREEITPVDEFIDIGHTLETGDSHEFTHQVLMEEQQELVEGNYRIRKEFWLVDDTKKLSVMRSKR